MLTNKGHFFDHGIAVNGRYRHFKGATVEVIAVAKEEANPNNAAVIYHHIGSNEVWSRPVDDFKAEVVMDHPDTSQRYRFEYLPSPEEITNAGCIYDMYLATYGPQNGMEDYIVADLTDTEYSDKFGKVLLDINRHVPALILREQDVLCERLIRCIPQSLCIMVSTLM